MPLPTDDRAKFEAHLLPCPFCGHDKPSFERMGTSRQSCIVACGNCGARHESSDENERSGSSWNARTALASAQAASAEPVASAECESRAMFVARLENMQANGDKWLTTEAVLALLNDCDMLASRSVTTPAPAVAPAAVKEAERLLPHAYLLAKVGMVVPLLQEARDAITALTEQQRLRHGISKTLADRMDVAGTFSLDDWQSSALATEPLAEPHPNSEGWRWVPVELTPEMIAAVLNASDIEFYGYSSLAADVRADWARLLAASPTPDEQRAQASGPQIGLLRQALEALEHHREQTRPIHRTDAVIEAIRAALAGRSA